MKRPDLEDPAPEGLVLVPLRLRQRLRVFQSLLAREYFPAAAGGPPPSSQ